MVCCDVAWVAAHLGSGGLATAIMLMLSELTAAYVHQTWMQRVSNDFESAVRMLLLVHIFVPALLLIVQAFVSSISSVITSQQ